MLDLIRALAPIRSGTVCDGLDQTVEILRQELDFTVHEFASGIEHNGWVVPWKWQCQKAEIRDQRGNVIYDGNAHPLGVASYSDSYNGPVLGGQLKKHVFFSAVYEDAIVYHCDWMYKPHERSWGFCAPKRFHDTIVDDQTYYVLLTTTHTPGTMKVCEYVLPGEEQRSIVLNAHSCHPGCANDDLSGIAVGIEVIHRLAALSRRRFTYRLIVAPEHYGSIFYLQRFGRGNIGSALFLESLGSTGKLALQQSFSGKSMMDMALRNALRGHQHYTGEFRSIVGNDETVWEAHNIEIACPSLSRCPFPEYHTSRDTPDLMSEVSLVEAVDVVTDALIAIDQDVCPVSSIAGLVCLSAPQYDLYHPFADPSVPGRRSIGTEAAAWNRFMNHLPRYFDGYWSALLLAERFGLPFPAVRDYLSRWEAKGLVALRPGFT